MTTTRPYYWARSRSGMGRFVSFEGGFHFTGIVEFLPAEADADQHAAMGFEVGWGLALNQLVALFA